MTALVARRIWVEEMRKLFDYVPVTSGEDAGRAYDLTITSYDHRPAGDDITVVSDLIELDKIKVQMSLLQKGQHTLPNAFLKASGLNRLANYVGRTQKRDTPTRRVYCVGHPKYK